MSAPQLPQLEPVRDDGVRAIQIGLGLWVVAGTILLLARDELADRGTQWWLAVCGAGLLVGVVQLVIFSRRRAMVQARERAAAEGAGLTGAGPSGAGPTGAGPTG
jgi:hypothetical protein